MNTHVQVFVWTCFHFSGYMPRVEYGSYDNSMLYLLRSCQAVFQSGCIILHYHKQYNLTNSSYYLFYYNHPHGHKVISHCGLDLHFPADQWYWAFFHIFISSLCIFFGEMSVHVFCLSFGLDCLSFCCCILCILDTRLLLDTWFANISSIIWVVFSLSWSFLFFFFFHYLEVSFEAQKFSVQMKSSFSIFFFICLCFWYHIEKQYCQIQDLKTLSYVFF